jgi:hypothetical protein
MKNYFLWYLNVLILILTISCASPVNVLVMPEYKNRKLPGADTIFIYPQISGILIENHSSLEDDLGEGDPVRLLSELIQRRLSAAIKENSGFKKAAFLDPEYKTRLFLKQFNVSSDLSLDLLVPPDGYTFQSDSCPIDFILFLQNIHTYSDSDYSYNPSGNSVNSGKTVKCVFEYFIWDNMKGKVVACGKGTSSQSTLFGTGKGTWENVVTDMAGFIFSHAPFEF